ncbi:MAG: hypothetical protein ABFR05_07040 [Bacteroidota bacterium]
MTNNLLLASQLKNKNLSKKENVNNLVRILARFGNIPKIGGINITLSKEEPELFRIVPGESIIIGLSYINNPVLALIYIRYAIEWQTWYNALNKDKSATLLYDLAALKVTSLFYDLLPKQDKDKLDDENYLLTDFIKENQSTEIDVFKINDEFLKNLQSFHGFPSSGSELKDSWKPVVECLAKPTELLLMSGGDLRLNVDEEELLNKYGCRPFPRPEAFTFASSTATSVSNYAFDNTEKARANLISESLLKGKENAAKDFSQLLRSDLQDALSLNNDCKFILSPSGTDSALQIAAITQIITKEEITHVLVGSDETGSGVPAALLGHHFENNTALGLSTKKGELIEGFREVEVTKIPFRDEKGVLKTSSQLDEETLKAVTKANDQGKFVVLHTMDQSKLGYQAPSDVLIQQLDNIDNLSLQFVVDASQLRLDSKDINDYLGNGYIVTITGSKYFTGPPYSGALIIPKELSNREELKEGVLPVGLAKYYNYSDWPTAWTCANILSSGFNYGASMRWNAAIAEMKRYFNTPILYRNLGIDMFCSFVEESIKESPFLEQSFDEEFQISSGISEDVSLKNIRTIFPFFIKKNNEVLDEENVKKLYGLLNSDISEYFDKSPLETQRLATQKCHIGQAVKVRYSSNQPSAILRISLGARVISDSWKDRDVSLFFSNIQDQMNQVTVIIKKMELILNQSELLEG